MLAFVGLLMNFLRFHLILHNVRMVLDGILGIGLFWKLGNLEALGIVLFGRAGGRAGGRTQGELRVD